MGPYGCGGRLSTSVLHAGVTFMSALCDGADEDAWRPGHSEYALPAGYFRISLGARGDASAQDLALSTWMVYAHGWPTTLRNAVRRPILILILILSPPPLVQWSTSVSAPASSILPSPPHPHPPAAQAQPTTPAPLHTALVPVDIISPGRLFSIRVRHRRSSPHPTGARSPSPGTATPQHPSFNAPPTTSYDSLPALRVSARLATSSQTRSSLLPHLPRHLRVPPPAAPPQLMTLNAPFPSTPSSSPSHNLSHPHSRPLTKPNPGHPRSFLAIATRTHTRHHTPAPQTSDPLPPNGNGSPPLASTRTLHALESSGRVLPAIPPTPSTTPPRSFGASTRHSSIHGTAHVAGFGAGVGFAKVGETQRPQMHDDDDDEGLGDGGDGGLVSRRYLSACGASRACTVGVFDDETSRGFPLWDNE
ncbi:hypothetical protein C8R46DRAFT_1357128 [Mycena filopes]|nr:hypothetical protein C8R46DRAFT_1357128 [Mycena filopes]